MFVGDRGLGIGSRLKGHLRYGGNWKPVKNSLYTSVLVTNEHNSSQTCLFCYKKLTHPVGAMTNKKGEKRRKTTLGSFVCLNPLCLSVLSGEATKRRDTMSAMAIGLSGLANFFFGVTFPEFDPSISQLKTEMFNKNATDFLNKKRGS
ncbi:MAG: hypothetical protein EXX96DRAFT_484224 [Benjaminiella poitrasii]|nr:MAG: hypothetical protein EXX96DRAFT_484224 [Benjaminiella poitrasii]